MRFQEKVTKREFAREILVGSMTLACLFAIFLFVAIHKATGKNLSPLAYLWPRDEKVADVDNSSQQLVKAQQLNSIEQHNRNKSIARTQADSEFNRIGAGPIKPTIGGSFETDPGSPENKSLPNRSGMAQQTTSGSFVPRKDIQLANHLEDDRRNAEVVTGDQTFANNNSTVAPDVSSKNNLVFNNDFERDKAESRFAESKQVKAPAPMPPAVATNSTDSNLTDSKLIPMDPADRKQEFSPTKNHSSFVQDNRLNKENINHDSARPASFSLKSPTSPETSTTSMSAIRDSNKQSVQMATAIRNSLEVAPKQTDSYWTLSQEYYGDGKYFDQLARFNGSSDDSDNLPKIVLIPSLNELRKLDLIANRNVKSKVNVDKGIYVTKERETLFDIAKEQLGSASRFVDLIKMNQNLLPSNCDAQTVLNHGLRLRMPSR